MKPANASQRTDRLDAGRTRSHGHGSLRLSERVACLRDRLEARADVRAAEGLRADVREARGHVRGWQVGHVSQDTAQRYANVVAGMRASGQSPQDAGCKATFEFRRAALVHATRVELKSNLRDLDSAKRSGDLCRAARAYAGVREGLETLRRYPPSTGSREQDLQRRTAFQGASRPPADRSNGKRSSLAGLPDEWRDAVQEQARPADKPALATMSLSGCRPAETRGIKVRQSENEITMEIRGAKTDDERGMKTRTLTFEKSELDNSQAGRDLLDWLGNRECRTVAYEGSVAAFRERVSRAADRAGYEQVSAYSFRHAEARELKESGADREEIASRLGHRSERSQSVYG